MYANLNNRVTQEFYDFVKDNLKERKTYVEIGAFRGDHLIAMADLFEFAQGIDIWTDFEKGDNGYFGIHNMRICENNIKKYRIKNIKLIREHSEKIVKCFEDSSIDMIYLDAAHGYDSVKRDLLSWIPKVKIGGIISGHDYHESTFGVIEAVNEIIGNPEYIFENVNESFFYRSLKSGPKNYPPSFLSFKK